MWDCKISQSFLLIRVLMQCNKGWANRPWICRLGQNQDESIYFYTENRTGVDSNMWRHGPRLDHHLLRSFTRAYEEICRVLLELVLIWVLHQVFQVGSGNGPVDLLEPTRFKWARLGPFSFFKCPVSFYFWRGTVRFH